MPQTQQTHRPGVWKQQNKGHKNGRHRSNREIQTMNKGKVGVKVLTKCKNKDMNRDQRRHLMKQKRKTKRDEMIAVKRSVGSENSPPILVIVYSSDGYVNVKPVIELFKNCSEDSIVSVDRQGSVHVSVPKFKIRYNFIYVQDGDLFGLMDAAKTADLLILVHSLGTEAEDDLLAKDERLKAIYFHFLPTTVHVINGLEGIPVKRRAEIKKNVMKSIESRFPDEKLHTLDNNSETMQFLHILGNCKRKINSYKKNRPQVLAESLEFTPNPFGSNQLNSEEKKEDLGKLIITGYVRNRTLDANSLVHIPGFGDYQMEKIEASQDPRPMRKSGGDKTMDIDGARKLIQKSDPMLQEPLEIENELDPMEGEQNFPTAEEIAAAAEELKQRKRKIKKVTKGTSDYQAAWIMDEEDVAGEDESDDEFDSDSDGEEEDGMNVEPKEEEESENEDNESIMTTNEDTITVNEDNEERYDEKIDVDQEEEERRKMKEARENEMFPDEIDTPMDVPARVRFARYRGLQSFAHSEWDTKENLPSDYSRIFQFENFVRTRMRILKELKLADRKDDKEGACPGTYVHVTLINVPKSVYDHFHDNPLKPLVMFGLLAHEQRMSVLNFVLHKSPSYQGVIKSKERLIFHVGCRRFCANPIFSAHTNGDKFKYERFLKEDDVTVASVYAPITFPPASVVVFKESGSSGTFSEIGSVKSGLGSEKEERRVRFDSQSDRSVSESGLKLVATGSLLSVNPDRLVIKRIVLSGHPFKINRRSAVIRYMFYNKEDINWFKPVELRTKFGRKGHIKESLGTHGHMKVGFDRPINSMDTVLMNLFKRVFPKWSYDPIVPEPRMIDAICEEENME